MAPGETRTFSCVNVLEQQSAQTTASITGRILGTRFRTLVNYQAGTIDITREGGAK